MFSPSQKASSKNTLVLELSNCALVSQFSFLIKMQRKSTCKHYLCPSEGGRVLKLLLNKHYYEKSSTVFPEALIELGTSQTDFFEYPLLMSPLKPHEAKSVAKRFVKLVCEAFEELHTKFKHTHLDLRL